MELLQWPFEQPTASSSLAHLIMQARSHNAFLRPAASRPSEAAKVRSVLRLGQKRLPLPTSIRVGEGATFALRLKRLKQCDPSDNFSHEFSRVISTRSVDVVEGFGEQRNS